MLRIFTVHAVFFLVSILLTACGQITLTPTALPSETATPQPTLTSTQTPSPVPSATATFTPLPTLGSGPYLLVNPARQSQTLRMYDTHGVQKIIELPPDGHLKSLGIKLDSLISPDGQWLVFYTGATQSIDRKTELPLTLKLLNIKDRTIKTVADVVTAGYEKKLDQLAEILKKLDPEKYKPQYLNSEDDGNWVGGGLISALEWGIYASAWSPDSHTLAFAAQIDGLSSDVYLYDLETGKVQQAEDSLQSVRGIRWSADGKKIIFVNSEPSFIYMGAPELHVINDQKEVAKDSKIWLHQSWIGTYDPLIQNWSPTGDWLTSNILLVTRQTPDSGNSGIAALNINTGASTILWEHIFDSYAIDPQNKTVLMGPSDFTNPESAGVYLIASNGRKTKIFNGMYYVDIFFRGGKKHRFILQGVSSTDLGYPAGDQDQIKGKIIGIDANGKASSFAEFKHKPEISISPDLNWLLMYNDETLNLYDSNDELVKTISIAGIQRIIWQPDSQAIFYIIKRKLYLLALPTGEPKLIDEVDLQDATVLP